MAVFEPIGVFYSHQRYPYDAARQASMAHDNSSGWIELSPGWNFEQALSGLDEGGHIWLLYQFHHNQNWKPMVLPPRGSRKKIGVFATRSPYRPNPIGLSAVQLIKLAGLKLYIGNNDLLNDTPIFDIKPYLDISDSYPNESPQWLQEETHYDIEYTDSAKRDCEFLYKNGVNLESFIFNQLSCRPTAHQQKRVRQVLDNTYELSYRTWRIDFELSTNNIISIRKIRSGYSYDELQDSMSDPYQDKALHREFLKHGQ